MAQISRSIHELTGALTQGHREARLLRPEDPLGVGSLNQLVAASINCQPERVDKRAPLFRAGGALFLGKRSHCPRSGGLAAPRSVVLGSSFVVTLF